MRSGLSSCIARAVLAALLASGGACVFSQEHRLTAADHGQTVDVAVNDTILLVLPENPTTGHVWALDNSDATPITILSSELTRTHPNRMGAPGVRTLRLKPTKVGTAHVQLKCWRPWEGDASVIERFELTAQVKD